MSDHPLCCECDDCLNHGGGTKPTHHPITYKSLGRPTVALKSHRQADIVALAHAYREAIARRAKREGAAA